MLVTIEFFLVWTTLTANNEHCRSEGNAKES